MHPIFRLLVLPALLLASTAAAAEAPRLGIDEIAKGAAEVLVAERPGQDGVLTVHDNMLYVQCLGRASSPTWRCEAAGLEGEPWLRNVLTPARQDALAAAGFRPDTATGNFVRRFPRSTAPAALAKTIADVLTRLYGADADSLLVLTDWLPAASCHARFLAGRDRGGALATPSWGYAKDVAPGCGGIATNTDHLNYDDPAAVPPEPPQGGEIDLAARYAAAMAAQLKRLESGQKHIWAIFEAGVPYVQCQYDKDDRAIYCEAASEDAAGAPLARILTPERRERLIAAGYEPPGKVVNYSRLYARLQFDETAVANALLQVLHDAYGYGGAPALRLKTERGDEGPL